MKRLVCIFVALVLLVLVGCEVAAPDNNSDDTSLEAVSLNSEPNASDSSESSFVSITSELAGLDSSDASPIPSVPDDTSDASTEAESSVVSDPNYESSDPSGESSDPSGESSAPSGEASGGGSGWAPPVTPPAKDYPDCWQFEILPTNYILYNGAAYSQIRFKAETAVAATKFGEVYSEYARLFHDTRINVVTGPSAAIVIRDPEITSKIYDVGDYLDKYEALMPDEVNYVNLGDIFRKYANEYLYFKSDVHWTHRGAYYAYCGFAESIGLTPVDIDSLDKKIISDDFIGITANYAGDEYADQIRTFTDTVEAYYPSKEHTMRVYYSTDSGNYREYDSCIVPSITNYSCFITGDQACVYINVPENDQNKSCLVIKDSYGDAFVTYLAEHYGKIIVIDPRIISFNVYEQFKDYGLDDIIFLTSASTTKSFGGWCRYYADYINYNID